MIELRHVGKVYQVGSARIRSLTDVSFRIDRGEFAVLYGPSGAGKTTLLRLLYRAAVPTEGEVEVLDQPLQGLRRSGVAALRRSIGVVFQDAKLLQARTVYENVAFVLRVLGTPRRAVTASVFEALRAVGLGARAQSYPSQLSQGEAQRAALARAIVRRPPLLLADEPTGNLDDEMADEVLGVIRDIWACGTTVLLVTHQARLVAQLRRRTLRLEGGRLVKDEGMA
jgi:cell division transport system ATP-binding protein